MVKYYEMTAFPWGIKHKLCFVLCKRNFLAEKKARKIKDKKNPEKTGITSRKSIWLLKKKKEKLKAEIFGNEFHLPSSFFERSVERRPTTSSNRSETAIFPSNANGSNGDSAIQQNGQSSSSRDLVVQYHSGNSAQSSQPTISSHAVDVKFDPNQSSFIDGSHHKSSGVPMSSISAIQSSSIIDNQPQSSNSSSGVWSVIGYHLPQASTGDQMAHFGNQSAAQTTGVIGNRPASQSSTGGSMAHFGNQPVAQTTGVVGNRPAPQVSTGDPMVHFGNQPAAQTTGVVGNRPAPQASTGDPMSHFGNQPAAQTTGVVGNRPAQSSNNDANVSSTSTTSQLGEAQQNALRDALFYYLQQNMNKTQSDNVAIPASAASATSSGFANLPVGSNGSSSVISVSIPTKQPAVVKVESLPYAEDDALVTELQCDICSRRFAAYALWRKHLQEDHRFEGDFNKVDHLYHLVQRKKDPK